MTLDRRIYKADARFNRATSPIWAQRWAAVMLRAVSAKNAQAMVGLVRKRGAV